MGDGDQGGGGSEADAGVGDGDGDDFECAVASAVIGHVGYCGGGLAENRRRSGGATAGGGEIEGDGIEDGIDCGDAGTGGDIASVDAGTWEEIGGGAEARDGVVAAGEQDCIGPGAAGGNCIVSGTCSDVVSSST